MLPLFQKKTLPELIKAGRLRAVRHIINADNCCEPDGHGIAPLQHALQYRQAKIVNYLFSLGCSLDNEPDTLISECLRQGDYKMAEVLCNHGLALPACLDGLPLLHQLILNPKVKREHFTLLTGVGANINHIDTQITQMTVLAWYVSQQNIRINTLTVRWLIELGADVNLASEPIKAPLWQALNNPELRDTQETMSVTRFGSVLNELVKGGLSFDLDLERYGFKCLAMQPLYQTRHNGFIQLLEAGMPVPETAKEELGSYLGSGRFGKYGVKKLLKIDRERGLNLPMSILIYDIPQQKKIVEALNEGDMRINTMFSDLVLAINHRIDDKLFMLGSLLKKGADINTPTKFSGYRFSPLQIAVCQHREIEDAEKLIAWLLDHGAAIECHGYSALHLAVWLDNTALVRLLFQHGADLQWQDENKGTVLSYLVSCNPWRAQSTSTEAAMMLRQLDLLWRTKGMTLPLADNIYFNADKWGEFEEHKPLGVIFASYRPVNSITLVRALLDSGWPVNQVMTTGTFSGNIVAFMLRYLKFNEDISPLLEYLPEPLDVNSPESGDPVWQAISSMASPNTFTRLLPLLDNINRTIRVHKDNGRGGQYIDLTYLLHLLDFHYSESKPAMRTWQVEICRMLLDQGASPDVVAQWGPDRSGDRGFLRNAWTALEFSVYAKNFDIFRLLLDRGANPHRATCVMKEQLVHLLCLRASTEPPETIIRHLDELERRGLLDIAALNGTNATPLLNAVSKCQIPLMRYLIARGAKLDVFGGFDNSGTLHRAISNWNWVNKNTRREAVELLLDAGTDPNLRDPNGDLPLIVAAEYGSVTALEVLLSRGADPTLTLPDGQTALHRAVAGADSYDSYPDGEDGPRGEHPLDEKLKITSFDKLIEAGVDINAVDNDGNTPLNMAIYNDRPAFVKALLERGAACNKPDGDGYSPLMLAVRYASLPVVHTLLKHADASQLLSFISNDGSTMLHAVCLREDRTTAEKLFRILEIKFAPAWKTNEHGITPLHYAAWKGHVGIVDGCCKRGVDVNTADSSGNTALHTAIMFDTGATSEADVLSIVTTLITAGADPSAVNAQGETALSLAAQRNLPSVTAFITRITTALPSHHTTTLLS